MRLFCILLCAGVMITGIPATAQFNVVPGGTPRPLGKVTTCYRYDFRTGDTLLYRVDAFDSVRIEGGQRFFKIRTERVRIVCDSVSTSGVMHLAITLVSMVERNVMGTDTTKRDSHPWVGRTQRIGIDSLGHRLYEASDDERRASVAPGGSMQPLLVPVIDTSCGRENQTWLSVDTLVLVENAVPTPVLVQQNYWRVLGSSDTLKTKSKRLQYTGTGIGSVVLRTREVDIAASTVIASFGRLTFSEQLNVILHQYATVENKFTMKVPPNTDVKGKHLIAQNVTLEYLRSPNRKRSWKLPAAK